ncbi:MAG: sialidase family protein [Elusimicrobiota bacterium]
MNNRKQMVLASILISVVLCSIFLFAVSVNAKTGSLPILVDEQFNNISGWAMSGMGTKAISPNGQLHLKNTVGNTVLASKSMILPDKYQVEVSYKVDLFGDDQGLSLYNGKHNLMLYFRTDGLYIKTWDGMPVKIIPWSSDTNWHTYKVIVDKGFGAVYYDGNYVDCYTLNKSKSAGEIRFFVGNATESEAHIDYITVKDLSREPSSTYTYSYNFEDEPEGTKPDYWMETTDNDYHSCIQNLWTVFANGANKVYRADSMANDTYSLLHVFARDVKFESKFKVNSSNTTTILSFHVRRNDDNSYLYASYSYSDQKWRIVERISLLDTVNIIAVSSSSTPLVVGWHTARIIAVGNKVSLYLDDINSPLLSGKTMKPGLGRVGLEVKNGDVFFDDVVYSGEGRVNKGVKEIGGFLYKNFSSTVLKLSNGKYIVKSTENGVDGVWESVNEGVSWTFVPLSVGHYEKMGRDGLVLNNGNLITLERRSSSSGLGFKYMAWSSEDCGVSWNGPYHINPDWTNRITMVGKLMQTTDGRIFFASGESSNLKTGGVHIYYSDDNGITWTISTTRHDYPTFGINLQEGAVVQTGPNTLKAFFRTDLKYLYESVSTDNGVSWSAPVATILPSPRVSFSVRRDPTTGYQYIAWENTDTGDYPKMPQYPRNRMSLAVSTDNTATWKMVTDLDDFMCTHGKQSRHMNTSMTIIDGAVWVVAARCPADGQNNYLMRIWKVKLDTVAPYNKLIGIHNVSCYQ